MPDRAGLLRAAIAACLAIAAMAGAPPAQAQDLRHLGDFTWPTDRVVGLSAIHVYPGGEAFMAIGDQGWLLEGQFERTEGEITDITVDRLLPLIGHDGLPVAARRLPDWSDAEGLAVSPEGHFWVSFERWARVARYDDPTAPAGWIKDHPGFGEHPENRQLEALALHPDGRLYTFPERPTRDEFPIYRLEGRDWVIDGHIPVANRFAIVGADFAPDGSLYLLERRLVLGWWWRNRIRRLDIDDPNGVEVLWTSGWGEYDNLEGLSIWQNDADLRLTLVSDNNGNPNEPAQFVEFQMIASE